MYDGTSGRINVQLIDVQWRQTRNVVLRVDEEEWTGGGVGVRGERKEG